MVFDQILSQTHPLSNSILRVDSFSVKPLFFLSCCVIRRITVHRGRLYGTDLEKNEMHNNVRINLLWLYYTTICYDLDRSPSDGFHTNK
jgi:hypothetical protein